MNDVKNISIKDYLEGIGVPTRQQGSKYFASSPFSRDSNWSFCIYPTNTYFDFSTGHGGDIVALVSRMDGISYGEAFNQLQQGIKHEKYKANYKKFKEEPKFWEDFKVEKYVNTNKEEVAQIHAYAKSRGITEGYFPGIFFTRRVVDGWVEQGGLWIRNPSLGFLHVDKNLKPCGAKFRKIVQQTPNDQSPRFSARGALGLYLLSTHPPEYKSSSPILYVVESESSANSLMMYMRAEQRHAIILSRGGVSSAVKTEDLPEHLQGLTKKLIIDYDGNEDLYQQRLKLYSGLDAQPIKLILPKGEDINSLYNKNQMYLIEHLLLK